ncbi:MAG: hypothetical protein JNL39_21215, partial [Opitutaceae bacterium]|nr:hypothetical protein [Opitutaceae bacterium]
ITAKLIQADGFQVGATEKADRELKNIFALHDEVAGLIAKNLSLKLGAGSAAATAAVNPEAFELYVQARQAFHRTTQEGHERTKELLTRALALEPNFARARAALSDVLRNLAQAAATAGGFSQRTGPAMSEIMSEAQRAVALDGDLPEARVALGAAFWMAWRFDEARRELGRAIALNANLASAHHLLARVQLSDGRIDEALLAYERAVILDPLFSRLADNYSAALYCAGRLKECIAEADRALVLQPQNWQAMGHRMVALARLGRTAEAIAEAKDGRGLFVGDVAYVQMLGGERAAAEQQLAGRPHTFREARALAALGRFDDCITAIQSGAMVAHGVEFLLFDRVFDPIREDPRFRKILDECGVTEAHARAQAWRKAHPPEKQAAR